MDQPEVSDLTASARRLLLDVAIGQGGRASVGIDTDAEAAFRSLEAAGYVEPYWPEPPRQVAGRRAEATEAGRAWIRGAIDAGLPRRVSSGERERWADAEAALTQGGPLLNPPPAGSLEPGAAWGQAALDEADEDAYVVTVAQALPDPVWHRAGRLHRFLSAMPPPARPDRRRARLERADEVCHAWGKPLLGPGGWLGGHTARTCPNVTADAGTWHPWQAGPYPWRSILMRKALEQ